MAQGRGRRRPTDWHPLAEKDPVPGDSEDIRHEVRKMKELAHTLRDQAQILRKVNDGQALKGKYADKIREKSGDLETRFNQTAERYERVVGDLGNWANDLEGFQERADGILKAAKQADEEHSANQRKKEAEAEKKGDDKPEDSDPDGHLAPYRRQLDDVTHERDSRARQYANNVGDDISDVLEDSTWENIAQGIDATLEVIGYISTALAIVAIFCTPWGWVAGLVLALSITSLVGHIALAATGEGSWTDVAFDVIGLVTLGLGARAMTALKASRALTKTAATSAAKVQKGRQLMQGSKNSRQFLDRMITRHGPDSDLGRRAMNLKQLQRANSARKMREAGDLEASAPMAKGRGIVEKEGRDLAADARRMNNDYGSSSQEVSNAAKEASSHYHKFVAAWGVGTGIDVGDKLVDGFTSFAGYDGYGDLKDVPTIEVGSPY